MPHYKDDDEEEARIGFRAMGAPTQEELEDMAAWFRDHEVEDESLRELRITHLFWSAMTLISSCSLMVVACTTNSPMVIIPSLCIQLFCISMWKGTQP